MSHWTYLHNFATHGLLSPDDG